MKKYILIILSLIFILSSVSCALKKDLPVTVTIEGKEYQRAFVGGLYPINEDFSNTDGVKKSGASYYKYHESQFDCYIAYGDNAEPNVYFLIDKYDEALSYYNDGDNFNFFCLMGNIHDENYQSIFELQDIDYSMFAQMLEFSENKDHDPLSSSNNEDGVKKVPIPNPDDWVANEIHFYKESKDGAFTTSRANTFVLYENELYLLYQYDFSNDKAPVMLIRPLPPAMGNYFCSVVENLKSE